MQAIGGFHILVADCIEARFSKMAIFAWASCIGKIFHRHGKSLSSEILPLSRRLADLFLKLDLHGLQIPSAEDTRCDLIRTADESLIVQASDDTPALLAKPRRRLPLPCDEHVFPQHASDHALALVLSYDRPQRIPGGRPLDVSLLPQITT